MTDREFEIAEYERDKELTERQLAESAGYPGYEQKYREQLGRINARLAVLRPAVAQPRATPDLDALHDTDVEDLCDDIRTSMNADDRQTRRERDAGDKALCELATLATLAEGLLAERFALLDRVTQEETAASNWHANYVAMFDRVTRVEEERDALTRKLAIADAGWLDALDVGAALRSQAERGEQDRERLEDALAKRCLADMNAAREAPNDWPAGQEWDDLVGSSQSIFRRRAREEAGVDAARSSHPTESESHE
jgi:hypothetical protein